MKRIILSVLISALLIPAFSQSLTLSNADGSVADGATINIWGELSVYIVAHMDVTNTSGSAMDVMVIREEISIITGSTNYFCWDMCFSPATDTSGTVSIAAGATNTANYSGDYFADGNPGVSTIKYTFLDASNHNDRVSFYVEYNGSPNGLDEAGQPRISVSKAYPNPAAELVAFDYLIPQDSKEVRVVVRDILGGVVKDIALESGEGSISFQTDMMNKGIYFYSVLVGNQVTSTRKLVIK